ncbi:hypothetical protein [Arthrobacter caoxuetaonis]|uniref:Uncharacterized protein n=1 Tax=Arthrobacter caoxuetaonis TaxID=2886935 RepID=A0A9X1SD77_9MICC|nr:hypothetical protein [Arthrobacter caoxuetaonis]MCC3299380.1 hypothetical protein [Arthrobacter caoxuetaonis]USQ59127.1 hypothetical protein NF551_18650 [Arthrobacter caoxuetaonis]
MGRKRIDGPDLSRNTPRADYRARRYGLEDDGASDLARRKRAARNAIVSAGRAIDRIRDRQNGLHYLPPLDQSHAGALIIHYNAVIKANRAVISEAEAASSLLAPMTRRVTREDRRRRRAAKRNKTAGGQP